MKSFNLRYYYNSDTNKVHSGILIETLLEKFGFKIADRKAISCYVLSVINPNAFLDPDLEQAVAQYRYVVEYDEEKVNNEDIFMLKYILNRCYGDLVTISDNAC